MKKSPFFIWALILIFFLPGNTIWAQGIETTNLEHINPSDQRALFFGSWVTAPVPDVPLRKTSNHHFASCYLVFEGERVVWLGSMGPKQGKALIYLDGKIVDTVDTYAKTAAHAVPLFEKSGLAPSHHHSIRVVVAGEKHPDSKGTQLSLDGFWVEKGIDYPSFLRAKAMDELGQALSGNKPYLPPESWEPQLFLTNAPDNGVSLKDGLFRQAFDKNIDYILESVENPRSGSGWVKALPAASEGRVLGAAAHTLRWEERDDLLKIVNEIIDTVASRQQEDGYCLPYDREFMYPRKQEWDAFNDERRNYDRTNLTRGMVAAGRIGNHKSLLTMRKFYDWLNNSQLYPSLLTGAFDGTSHNLNNGHPGGLLMYFSEMGKPQDLEMLEKTFVQDYFIEQMQLAEPLAMTYYPYHVPHSYVLLAFGAWLDHYRATGHPKYLKAALGAWQVISQHFQHAGGSIAICEEHAGAYPPQSYYLKKHTGETCGSVFWTDINHRLLRHFPSEEKYAAEIEKSIYNVLLAAQDSLGSIRYHNHLHGRKQEAQHVSTCCEVNGSPLLARLPEFIYSLDEEGIWVNLFSASTINWKSVNLTTKTEFPYSESVSFSLDMKKPTQMALRLRIPSWLNGPVNIEVNGKNRTSSAPGTYFTIERKWQNGDEVVLKLPLDFRLERYTGLDQSQGYERYALSYGPLLMPIVGKREIDMNPQEALKKLEPVAGKNFGLSYPGTRGLIFSPIFHLNKKR